MQYKTNYNSNSLQYNYVYRGGYNNRRPHSRVRDFRNAYRKSYLGRTDQNLMRHVKDMVVMDEEKALTEETESNSNKNEAPLGLEEPTIDINSALESIISKNECTVASQNVRGETIAISSKETAKRRLSSTDVSDWNLNIRVINEDSNKTEPIVKRSLSLNGLPDSKKQKIAVSNALSTSTVTKPNLDGKAEKTVDNIVKTDYQKTNTNPYYPSLSRYKIPKKKFSEPNETIISTISELFKQVVHEAKPTDRPEDSKRASDERHKPHKKFTEGPKMPSKRKNATQGVLRSTIEKSQQIGKCRYKGALIHLKPCSVILERCKAFLHCTVKVSFERSPNKVQISSSNCSGTIDKDPTEVPQVFNDKPVHNVSNSKQHNELGCKKQYNNNNNNLISNSLEVEKGEVDGSEKNVKNVNKISFEHYIKRKRLNSDNKVSEVPESKRLISSESKGRESSSDQPEVKRIHSEGSKEVSKNPEDSREVFPDSIRETQIERLSDVPDTNNPGIESRVSNNDAHSNIRPVPNNYPENNDNKSDVLQRTSYSVAYPSYSSFPKQTINEQFSLIDKILHFSEYTKMRKEPKVSRHFSASRVNLGISIESKPAIRLPEVEQSTSIRAKEETVTNNYPEVENFVKKEPSNMIISCIHYAIKSEIEPFEDCCSFILDAHPELETCQSEEIPVTERFTAIMKITEVFDKTEIIHQKIPKLEKFEKLSSPDVTFIDLTESEDNNNNAHDKITLYRSEEVGFAQEEEVLALSACLPGMSYLKSREAPKTDQFHGKSQEKAPKIGRYLTVSKSLFETTESINPTNTKIVLNEPMERPLLQNYPTITRAICNEPFLAQKNLTTGKNDSNKAPSPVQISALNPNNRNSHPAPDVPVINSRTTFRENDSNNTPSPVQISAANPNNRIVYSAPVVPVINARITSRGNNDSKNAPSPVQTSAPSPNIRIYPALDVPVTNARATSRGLAENSLQLLGNKASNVDIPSPQVYRGNAAQNARFPCNNWQPVVLQQWHKCIGDLVYIAICHQNSCKRLFNLFKSKNLSQFSHHVDTQSSLFRWRLYGRNLMKSLDRTIVDISVAFQPKQHIDVIIKHLNGLESAPIPLPLFYLSLHCIMSETETFYLGHPILKNFYMNVKATACAIKEKAKQADVREFVWDKNQLDQLKQQILLYNSIRNNMYRTSKESDTNNCNNHRRNDVSVPNRREYNGISYSTRNSSYSNESINRLSTIRRPYSTGSVNSIPSVNSSNSNQLSTLRSLVSPTLINQAQALNNLQLLSNRPLTWSCTSTGSSTNVNLPINVPFNRYSNDPSVNPSNSNQLSTLRNSVSPTSINQAPNNAQLLSNRPLTEPCTITGSFANVDLPINAPFDRSNVSKSTVNANPSFNDDLFVETVTNNCSESNRDEEVIDSFACVNKNGIVDELSREEKFIDDSFACDNKDGIVDGSIRDGEVIDLTWLDSIDCEELKLDVDFIKKEEPIEDEERYDSDGSSTDEISSTYQYLYSGRLCICEKLATFICDCRMVMYCGPECQLNDWKQHKPICMKMKQLE